MTRPASALRWIATVLLVTALNLGVAATIQGQQTDPRGRKSPGLALALSVLLPGAGQVYNGDYLKGAGTLAGAALTVSSIVLTTSDVLALDDDTSGTDTHIVGGLGLGLLVWSWIDAPLSAKAINRRIDAGNMAVEVGPSIQGASPGAGVTVRLLRMVF